MQIKGDSYCSVLLRGAPSCPQQFVVLHGTPGIIQYSLSALSLICSSVDPSQPVSILVDVLKKHRKFFSFLKFLKDIERGT